MNPLAWLEADMARHMLVEFPLVIGLGAALARYAPARFDAIERLDTAIARFDAYGITGWLAASLVAAFWMIPAALDAALASGTVNAAKLASLLAAGFALRGATRRSPPVLEAFFVGNFAWMAATVGLLYQEAEARLCLGYIAASQQAAGRGLVVLAMIVLVAWLVLRSRYIFSSASARSQAASGGEARSSASQSR